MAPCQKLILIASEGGANIAVSEQHCGTGQEGTFLPKNIWLYWGQMKLCPVLDSYGK